MRGAAGILVLVALATVAASASAGQLDLSRYALTASDVPPGLKARTLPHISVAQAARELTLDEFHFMNTGGYHLLLMGFHNSGYLDGYQVTFVQGPAKGAWAGQTVIASHVSAYSYAKGAQLIWFLASIDYLANDFKCHSLTGSAAVGEEAHLCSKFEKVSGHNVVTYELAWRQGTFRGSLVVAGRTSVVRAAQALALARVQEARMKTA
jgi:hypothetical protein